MPSPGIIGAIAIGALHFWQIGPEIAPVNPAGDD
jgi:hypothetical protein